MTDSSGPPERRRALFVNGEALRVDVTAPRTGGGQKYEPQSPEQARELLLPQINTLISASHAIQPELRATDWLYVEARLLPNYIAASEFPTALLSQIGAIQVGSRADSGVYETPSRVREVGARRLILAVEDEGLQDLSTLVELGGQGRSEREAFSEIRKLDEVSLPAPERIIQGVFEPTTESTMWEAVLNPAASFGRELLPLDEETLDKWFALIERVGGVVYRDFVRYVGGLTFTPVSLSAEVTNEVVQFNPLRAIRPMPSIRPLPSFGLRVRQRAQPPTSTASASDAPKVAIFDGGVDINRGGSPFFPTPSIDLTIEPEIRDGLAHGTAVTGAVMYGLLHDGDQADPPPLPVDSYRVIPQEQVPGDLEGYWILDRIKEVVSGGDYQLVNLSLGPRLAVEDAVEPNRWTCELDQLAWENDVLFVVAAGNDGREDRTCGLHRVQVPADMANGLSVGACDAPHPNMPWARAPYSSMGPGRQGNRIQPVGVQFGGVDGREFPLLTADGSFLFYSGTSFAAPLVSHALAALATRLPNPNPSVLRAFAAHFAERPRNHIKLRDEVGYGRLPLSFADHLECSPNEVHVLYVDEIGRGQLLGYQVPIPHGSNGDLSVRITLAYASPVEPTQPTEYTRAALEVAFRPHQHMFRLTPPTGTSDTPVVLDIRTPEASAKLSSGWTLSQEPVTKSLVLGGQTPEYLLRDNGKWETLRSVRTKLPSGQADGPRLEVSYVARRAGALDASPPTVPFALLITVEDKSAGGDLYDRARAQFPALRPVQRLAARTRVRASR